MKYYFSFLLITTSLVAHALPSDFPTLPTGTLTYQDQFVVHRIRRALGLNHNDTEDALRIRKYKRDGYTCIRTRSDKTKCHIDSFPETRLDGIANPLFVKLASFRFEFTETTSEPQLTYDGSNQEWTIPDPVLLNGKRISWYRLTRTSEGLYALSFPVSTDQPIGILNISQSTPIGLSLTASSKDGEFQVTYFIEAFFKRAP